MKEITTTSILRPPIVAILGHVDHGKTTLLDTIRKTNVTGKEAGGITQHIGAYQVKVQSSKFKVQSEQNRITFIDTPGHEAFAKMRSRGTSLADIAILVVAANDGVMPQTIESIKYIKAAGIPVIVALNKTDLPDTHPDQVKSQLAQNNVLVEGYGGDVVVVPVSAKTGKGIPELLEMILLLAELKEITGDPGASLEAMVVEAKLDKKRGRLATLIIKNGTLNTGQTIYAAHVATKVRSLVNDQGLSITSATLSQPVEVMGWETLPAVGEKITSVLQEIVASTSTLETSNYEFSLPPIETINKLKLILKTDVAGSLEAILANLGKEVELIATGTGEITESDVLLAKSTGAFIIGFGLKVSPRVTKLAKEEKVRLKVYTIIYELLDEVAEVIALLNKPEAQEKNVGSAHILAEFKFSEQRVAGSKIVEGRIARGDMVKILRDEAEIGRGRIKSLRHGKDDIPKAEVGDECGVVFDKKLDFQIGDSIIAYRMHELLA